MNRSGAEVPIPEKPNPPSPSGDSNRDPYRGVVIVLLVAAFLGTAGTIYGGMRFSNPLLFDVAITLGLSTGILVGIAAAQIARAKRRKSEATVSNLAPENEIEAPAEAAQTLPGKRGAKARLRRVFSVVWIKRGAVWTWTLLRNLRWIRIIRIGTAVAGVGAIVFMLWLKLPFNRMSPHAAEIAAGICVGAAGLAALATHYLSDIEPALLPEAPWLCRGTRVIAWILLLTAASMGLAWAEQQTILRILHFTILAVDAAVCYGLFTAHRRPDEVLDSFPLDLGVLSLFGSRANILASVLDTAERQLGIDLRSTWALTVVRRSIEPLLIGLFLMGWFSTSLTVVGVEEQGLVERLGVPVEGPPLMPGMHLHLPWPVDRVFRIPVQRVQALQIGHEGQEAATGPENVLWAVEHATNEYTLLLGNGRDLITVDAAVQYRIADARAWRYHSQNPADALRAIAYRAVMRSTVNLTLSEALSENVATLTAHMRDMMQQEADALGLGVTITGFTVGGMHPPVQVAPDYEAVVSAQLGEVTAVADAQTFLNQTVPAAEASVLVNENTARANGDNALAQAAGDAWSFRTLESQYRAAPEEYFFRRRLETLEKVLAARRYTVVDSRYLRDGGELWSVP